MFCADEERAFRMKLDFCISGAGSHWKTAGRSYGRNGVDDAGSWRHGRCVSEIYHRSIQCDAGAGF